MDSETDDTEDHHDAGPDGRQALATAIFKRTDVLGFQRLEYELTADAIELGLDAALPAVHELEKQIGEFGRGERACASQNRLNVERIRLAPNPNAEGHARLGSYDHLAK